MPERRAQRFVEELARDPDLVARLLAAHTPDANGRCCGCSQDSSIRPSWPCGPRGHAYLAQQRIDQARRPRWITP
jgi:hypothetical protein